MVNEIFTAWLCSAENLGEFYERLPLEEKYIDAIGNYAPNHANQFYGQHGQLPEPLSLCWEFFEE